MFINFQDYSNHFVNVNINVYITIQEQSQIQLI